MDKTTCYRRIEERKMAAAKTDMLSELNLLIHEAKATMDLLQGKTVGASFMLAGRATRIDALNAEIHASKKTLAMIEDFAGTED